LVHGIGERKILDFGARLIDCIALHQGERQSTAEANASRDDGFD
jgi:hypothetical protein